MLTIASVVSFFCVNSELQSRTYCETVLKNVPHAFDGNWQPSWFCITFSIPKPVESNVPINSSDFRHTNWFHQIPRSNQQKSLADALLGRPLSMWIGKMQMFLGVLESKKWGETSPWKRRWNTKLGINDKPIMILSFHFFQLIFLSISSTSPMMGCFGFSHDVVSLTVGNSTVLRQGKPGMKNEAFRWNRLWCLESNIQVDSKERFLLNDVAIQGCWLARWWILCFFHSCVDDDYDETGVDWTSSSTHGISWW